MWLLHKSYVPPVAAATVWFRVSLQAVNIQPREQPFDNLLSVEHFSADTVQCILPTSNDFTFLTQWAKLIQTKAVTCGNSILIKLLFWLAEVEQVQCKLSDGSAR